MSKKDIQCASQSNTLYALGVIGALIYYLSIASGIGDVLFGILKAILWPAFVVYELMQFLGM